MAREVEVGDWIWVKHWRGPFVRVSGMTPRRFYIEGQKESAYVDRESLVGVAESKDTLSAARKAFFEAQNEREPGLSACKDVVRAARAAQDAYERETRRLADEAVRSLFLPLLREGEGEWG